MQLAAVKTLARPAFSSSAAVQRNAKRITREFVFCSLLLNPGTPYCSPGLRTTSIQAVPQNALRCKIGASNYAAPDHWRL